MGREIRNVPINWEHPKKKDRYTDKEIFRPMYQRDFRQDYFDWEKEINQWYIEQEAFEKGKIFSYGDKVYSKEKGNTYEDWAGAPWAPPNPYDYMPEGPWFQLYENVSEGTPISPPFSTKEALVEWLTNNPDYWGNQWTKEQAEGILKCEYTPSMVMTNGRLYNSQEAAELQVQMEGDKK